MGLDWYGGSFGDAVDGDTVVGGQVWIEAVGESPCFLVWVEAEMGVFCQQSICKGLPTPPFPLFFFMFVPRELTSKSVYTAAVDSASQAVP